MLFRSGISASEKGSQWAQALALLRKMSDRMLVSNVLNDIHLLVNIANSLHLDGASDDLLEYNLHRFAYDPVLRSFGLRRYGRVAWYALGSCERSQRKVVAEGTGLGLDVGRCPAEGLSGMV